MTPLDDSISSPYKQEGGKKKEDKQCAKEFHALEVKAIVKL